jgi:hypothetical protein
MMRTMSISRRYRPGAKRGDWPITSHSIHNQQRHLHFRQDREGHAELPFSPASMLLPLRNPHVLARIVSHRRGCTADSDQQTNRFSVSLSAAPHLLSPSPSLPSPSPLLASRSMIADHRRGLRSHRKPRASFATSPSEQLRCLQGVILANAAVLARRPSYGMAMACIAGHDTATGQYHDTAMIRWSAWWHHLMSDVPPGSIMKLRPGMHRRASYMAIP